MQYVIRVEKRGAGRAKKDKTLTGKWRTKIHDNQIHESIEGCHCVKFAFFIFFRKNYNFYNERKRKQLAKWGIADYGYAHIKSKMVYFRTYCRIVEVQMAEPQLFDSAYIFYLAKNTTHLIEEFKPNFTVF